ncbi:hypothetical protein [Variovorax sp. PvP013]|uniref:hypothetical protein n=1 Tax=Variovorax sp. PvP013 TaxID=3156435 RepID=UPI003D230086
MSLYHQALFDASRPRLELWFRFPFFDLDCPRMPLNYQALFDASPNPYLILDRSLNIAGANKAYLKSTRRTLSDIVGRWT